MKTQREKVLEVLENANGKWVSGRYFLQTLMLSQYHARIWELQREGYLIEASSKKDEFGFKSYRIKKEPVQTRIFESKLKEGTYGAYKNKLNI